jgi:hypothetical protein
MLGKGKHELQGAIEADNLNTKAGAEVVFKSLMLL